MPCFPFAPLLIVFAILLNACASSPAASDFTTRKDVVFTTEKWPTTLGADFYKPASKIPTAAVLLIHGGGWTGKERRSDMGGIAKSLAKRGYFVMNTTYRLAPQWEFPAQKNDMDEALRYLRKNSLELNIDPARIATFGYSAGGHLAALAGFDQKNDIKAIVAGGAPTNLAFWPKGKLTGSLLGGPLKGNEAIYREASPVNHVTPASPPVFIYHGTKDKTVPTEHPKALIVALEKNEIGHETYWIKGRSHVFTHLFPAKAIEKAIDFLDQHL